MQSRSDQIDVEWIDVGSKIVDVDLCFGEEGISVLSRKVDKLNYFEVRWWSKNFSTDYQVPKKVRKLCSNKGNKGNLRWERPTAGVYKINCSALVDLGKNKVGIGIVIRDDSGFVMASCYQILVDTFDDNVVGIMAIHRGIIFRKDCGLTPCILESDKEVAVSRVVNDNFLNASYSFILVEINSLRSLANDLNIRAIPKQANYIAQNIVKIDLATMENKFWMEDFPNCIKDIVEADMLV
ncbi:hypothetical protein Ddye_015123 [Dipteronia dyeriana]|uniref:RNase H type-1 domain-containing protein n=1 Tax=Dipteronia dyeriana TaxID=168575 RepID=A0AAD9U4S6_9ROSI|nr:hypothetical protein Ddye_015123 [Dipteronia dyeriana]